MKNFTCEISKDDSGTTYRYIIMNLKLNCVHLEADGFPTEQDAKADIKLMYEAFKDIQENDC
jgi:hypothetical protein